MPAQAALRATTVVLCLRVPALSHSTFLHRLGSRKYNASIQTQLPAAVVDELESSNDERYMRLALEQAQAAYANDEVPIGAVLVCGSDVVSTGQNRTEVQCNPLAHAELQCIMSAAETLQAWRLQDATLYCTVEPCPMCAGAILQARLKRLVYGARQPRLGADGSWVQLFPAAAAVDQPGQGAADGSAQQCTTSPECSVHSTEINTKGHSAGASYKQQQAVAGPVKPTGQHPFHPNLKVTRGVLEEECRELMTRFFKARRQQQKATKEARKTAAALVDACQKLLASKAKITQSGINRTFDSVSVQLTADATAAALLAVTHFKHMHMLRLEKQMPDCQS